MKRRRWASCRRQEGFTLVEQILVGLIVVTLSCVATPALSQLLKRHRLQTAQLDLVSALHHARGLAVTTGRRTMLCPTRDGQRCVDEVHWEGGWLMGHYRTSQTDRIDGKPLFTGSSHDTLTILSTVGRQRVRFQNDGGASGNNVTFTLCHRGHADGALTVVVSGTGRVRSPKTTTDQASTCANASITQVD